MKDMNRRRYLALLSVSSLSVAGCLGGMPRDAVVRAVQQSSPENKIPISYTTLPQAEQEIARTAVEEEYFHACPDLSDAVRTFADRFTAPDTAYLGYQGTFYAHGSASLTSCTQQPPHRQNKARRVASSKRSWCPRVSVI